MPKFLEDIYYYDSTGNQHNLTSEFQFLRSSAYTTSNPPTKATVGLSNVANERQYSASNPPPAKPLYLHRCFISSSNLRMTCNIWSSTIASSFTTSSFLAALDHDTKKIYPCSGVYRDDDDRQLIYLYGFYVSQYSTDSLTVMGPYNTNNLQYTYGFRYSAFDITDIVQQF